jgi:hypothetical protein
MRGAIALVAVLLAWACAPAFAEAPGPGWSIQSLVQPTNLSVGSKDGYTLLVTNVGSQPTGAGAPVVISDALPAGVHATSVLGQLVTGAELACSVALVQCVGENIPAGETAIVRIDVSVEVGAELPGASNLASVSGGGAPAVSTTEPLVFDAEPAPFRRARRVGTLTRWRRACTSRAMAPVRRKASRT